MPSSRTATAESLADEIAVLSSAIYAAEARLLERLEAFDAAACYETLDFPSTAHWLNYRCGVSMNAAREKVRVAKCLTELPKIREAFAEGLLSYSKVRAVTRVATPETDAYLLMVARHATAHHIERLVAKCRRAKMTQDEALAEAVYENRNVSIRRDESGGYEFRVRLPAEQGAMLEKALEYVVERNARAAAGVTAETSADKPTGRVPTPVVPSVTTVSWGQRRADALVEVAETFLAHPDHTSSTADRCQVVVHVTAPNTDDNPADVTAVTPYLEDGQPIAPSTAKRLACDASTVAVRENATGEPLSIGRKSRSIPPPMRRALTLRDGGCRFPGCTRTRFVDGHHIVHWADGGETSLKNLVLLCRHHHRLVHSGGFDCRKTEDGEVVFIDREQRPIPDTRALPGLGGDFDAWLDRQIFDHRIDPESCRAQMDATDVMDYHEASIPLLPLPPEMNAIRVIS